MIDKFLELAIGSAVTWIMLMEVRFNIMKNQLKKIEVKNEDDKIKSSVEHLSDAELDGLLSKQLEPKPANGDPKT